MLNLRYLNLIFIPTFCLLTACSWNVDDYEEVKNEVKSTTDDLQDYWKKKLESRKGQMGHGWNKLNIKPELKALVRRGLENSPTIASIYYKLDLVRGERDIINSYRIPKFDLLLGVDSTVLGGVDGISIGPRVSWEVDLLNKIANAVEASDQKVLASETLYKYARETLIASIVKSWVSLSNRKKIYEITVKQRDLYVKLHKNVEARYQVGKSPSDDLQLSLASLQRLNGRVLLAERLVETAKRRLSFIVGDVPKDDYNVPADLRWDKIPKEFNFSVVETRYDIIAAQRSAAASSYSVDSAKLAKFPAFRVGAFAGYNLIGNYINSYTAGFNQPLYRGGEINANIDMAQAAYRVQVAAYRTKLLQVAREVERGYVNLDLMDKEIKTLIVSSKTYASAYKLRNERYKIGKMELQDLITLQQQWLSIELRLANREHSIIQEAVDFYVALGRRFYDKESKYPHVFNINKK